MLGDYWIFFARWLRQPRKLGIMVPSSRFLARAMARQVDLSRPGVIVELGGGTGAVTTALLESGVSPSRLVVIERDGEMHALLQKKFPGVKVIYGDARMMKNLLEKEGISQVNAVVSSLPMLALKTEDKSKIISQSFEAMGEGGTFIQYTYSMKSSISESDMSGLNTECKFAKLVLFNFPPATLWTVVSA